MKVFDWLVSIALVVVIGVFAFLHLSPDYNIYLMRSESMKPTINMGDMVVTGPPYGPLSGEIKPGMIVTYEHGEALITHRVLTVSKTLVTKGDAEEDPDPWSVTLSNVKGTYLFRLPYIGFLSYFIRTRLGWFLLIVAPAMFLVALLIRDIIKEVVLM